MIFFISNIPLYIDPGTGMVIIQLLVAGFASLLVFFKNVREKIKKLFNKK
tara:strand:+ start:676 stop:825 length:150 start_codon:yes stop_codon:yes gene_type:complete